MPSKIPSKNPQQSRDLGREDAALLKAVVETAVDGILTIDEAGIIITANPAVERIFGYSQHELVGENVKKLMPPEYSEEHDGYLASYLQTGVRKIIGIGREVCGLRKNGEVFPMDLAVGETVIEGVRIFTGIVKDVSERKRSEEARARLAALVESSDDAIISKTLEGVITSWNRGAELMFGYCSDEVVGQPMSILIPEDRIDEEPGILNKLQKGEKIEHYETIRRRKDGTLLNVSLTVSPVRDASGAITGASKIARDITERKKAEELLRNAHAQLNHLLDHSPAVLYALKVEGQSVEPYMISRNITELLGYEVTEAMSFDWWAETLHPDDRELAFASVAETLSKGVSRTEYRLRHKEGGFRCVEDKRRLTIDATGQPKEMVGVWTDITERKEMEEALHTSEERFRELLENVELIAVILDREGRVSFCNDYLLDLTGWEREEVLGHDWFPTFDPAPDAKARYADIRREAVPAHSEGVIRTKSGDIREISWNTTILRDRTGDVIGVASIGQDVTERNHAAQLLREAFEATEMQVRERTADLAALNDELRAALKVADSANQAKSEFLSRMSHELRTPMNSVLGYAQLLDLQQEDPKIKQAANSILRNGKHLLEMINEVLDISRIEAGSLTVSVEEVSFGETLLQAVGLVQPIADGANIRFVIESGLSAEVKVEADRQRLLQVLINLLGNAVKYNRNGGQVTLRLIELPGDIARFEVTDTGPGISQQDQGLLFQPFQRFCDPGIEGTGLGLALSQRFVTLMGGTLGLSDSTESGSTFYVELKLLQSVSQSSAAPLFERRSGGSSNLKGTVLYIEDNTSNMRLLEAVLEDWHNLTLIPANQGLVGFEMAREHQPDLILLDIHLPDMPGDQVLRRLKSDPATQNIPVVILSADATKRQIEALRSAGAADYLTKPVDLQQLFDVLREHIAG